ncbi:MAG: transcriptional regulator [Pseudomonadota bacterium]
MLYTTRAGMAAVGLILALILSALPARAAELVMVEEKWCDWCQRWEEEIGVVYAKTTEGKTAPLRRVDIHGDEIETLALKSRAHYTPTFVLMDDDVEIGRIEGYPGEDFFWGMLGQLLDRLPAQTEPTQPNTDAPPKETPPKS